MNTFSILIPAYNAEKTIKRCLDSIFCQIDQNDEIIVIDDGSKDNTQAVLNEYADRDNLKIIYSDNGGVSVTRQKLIRYATKENILFCDADDFYEAGVLDSLRKIIEINDPDVIIFGYNLVRSNQIIKIKRRKYKEGYHEAFEGEYLLGITDLYWSALWNKCYKKSIINSPAEIYFQTLIEDVQFNIEYISRCQKIYVLETALYNYVQIGESLTRGEKEDSRERIVDALYAYEKLFFKIKASFPENIEKSYYSVYCLMDNLIERSIAIEDFELKKVIDNSEVFAAVKKHKIHFMGRLILRSLKHTVKKFFQG